MSFLVLVWLLPSGTLLKHDCDLDGVTASCVCRQRTVKHLPRHQENDKLQESCYDVDPFCMCAICNQDRMLVQTARLHMLSNALYFEISSENKLSRLTERWYCKVGKANAVRKQFYSLHTMYLLEVRDNYDVRCMKHSDFELVLPSLKRRLLASTLGSHPCQ